MSLDYHLDYSVKLSTEIEHSSLYTWCIREFDEHGKQVGLDQIPWSWSLRFGITNLSYNYSVEHDDNRIPRLFDENDTSQDKQLSIEEHELIYAVLKPVDSSAGSFFSTSFSMFGTNRTIESFSLRVVPSEEEYCSVYGGVSYTSEIDFRDETVDDCIEIHIGVSLDKFNRFRHLIETKSVDEGYLRLGNVPGFYSEWSPSISASRIKVLARAKDQKLDIPDGCEIEPRETGEVKNFDLSFIRSHKLKSKGDELEETNHDDDLTEKGLLEQAHSEVDAQTLLLLKSAHDLKRSLKRLAIPLWVISFLLLLVLFS